MMQSRHAIRAGLAAAAVLAAVACGEGRAIFNVDVQSFLTASGDDTVRYRFPSVGAVDTASNPQKVNLVEGLGSSVVEEVSFTGTVQFRNDSNNVTLGFQLFIDSTSAGTLSPTDTAINIPPTALTGADTITVGISGNLASAIETLFTKPELWFRVAVAGTNTSGGTATGKMIVTTLNLRVVIQENIF